MRKVLGVALVALVALVLAAPAAAQVTVMDQLGPTAADLGGTGASFASQEFEAGFATFNVGVIDNFTIGGSDSILITNVSAATAGFAAPFTTAKYTDGSLTGWRVEFYSSTAAAAANLTGDVGSILLAFNAAQVAITTPYTGALSARADLDVSGANIVLAPGSYFVAVIPVMPFTNNGQIGILNSTFATGFPNDTNAAQANPGGGFSFPGNFQTITPASNAAYRIVGNIVAVPEPTTMALGGLIVASGGYGFLRRRKALAGVAKAQRAFARVDD